MAKTATEFGYIYNKYVSIAFRDSNGYPIGQETAPDSVSNGTTSGAYVVNGLVEVNHPTVTRPRVTNFGGQEVLSVTTLPANDYGVLSMQLSQKDETLHAYMTGTSIDVSTNTAQAIRAMNAAQETFPDFMTIISVRVTDSQTGGEDWDNFCILNHQLNETEMASIGLVTGDQNTPPLTYELKPSLSTRDISGALISALGVSATGDKDAVLYRRSDNPLHSTTFVGDGILTTCTLPYLPVSDDATGAGENEIRTDGVTTTVTSVATATGVVTFSSAPAAGEIVTILYETRFLTA